MSADVDVAVDVVNTHDMDSSPPRRVLITKYEVRQSLSRGVEWGMGGRGGPSLHLHILLTLFSFSTDNKHTQDIVSELRKDKVARGAGAGGGGASHFDIEALGENNSAIMLHLTKLPSIITTDTEFVFHPGRVFERDMVNDLAILASDPDSDIHDDDDDDSGGFTVLSVNLKSGDTRGLQRKKGGQIQQLSSPQKSHPDSSSDAAADSTTTSSSPLHGRMMAQQSDRKFSCGVDHAHSTPHGHGNTPEMKTSNLRSATIPQAQAMESSMASDTTTFVINLVVAIDADFINIQGGTGPSVEYINWLISATNAILEPEVGARLKVVKIEETDVFESANELDDGLTAMKKNFAGTIGGNKNLVHALLGRHIGGGIAYVGEYHSSIVSYLRRLLYPSSSLNRYLLDAHPNKVSQ